MNKLLLLLPIYNLSFICMGKNVSISFGANGSRRRRCRVRVATGDWRLAVQSGLSRRRAAARSRRANEKRVRFYFNENDTGGLLVVVVKMIIIMTIRKQQQRNFAAQL